MHRKPLLVVGLLLSIVGVSFVAYGYIFATSNQVSVSIQYAVQLLPPSVSDRSITLNAAVTNNGVPARDGLAVDFYYSIDGGVNWTYFATQFTDTGGVAQAVYTAPYNGVYDFKAVVTVP
jgi:hypothetical protein